MSDSLRNILVAVLVVCMAVFSFFSGYLANDYNRQREAREAVSEDEFAIFWEAWERVESNFLGDLPSSEQLTYSAIRGSLRTLEDPYTIFLEPVRRQEERENLSGNFGGVGVNLSRDDSGNIVLEPSPDNPAANAGVLSGDVLIAIDGEAVPMDVPVGSIAEQLRGEKGTTVVLMVLREGSNSSLEIAVERDDILIPSVLTRLLGSEANVGYIQLTRFSAESGGEIQDAILSLQARGADKFIFDLRNNGGGLVSAAIDVSNQLLDNKTVYHQITRGQGESSESTGRGSLLDEQQLVVLVNGGTASSSEIVAGALQDHERAILIGEKTFGKGSVQLVYDLSDGSSVHVTWARWLTPLRREIDKNGLEPNIVVAPTQEGIDNGRDEPLERAIGYLQSGS